MNVVQRVPLDFEHAMKLGDGELNALLKQQLKRLAQDVMDRPGDPAKRKVMLTFEVQPVVTPKGTADTCKIVVECSAKIPVYRTPEYDMLVTSGGFMFNADDPSSIDQQVLFEGEHE